MGSRRMEKVTRLVQQAVGEIISNDLSDPRIQGLISVTRVTMAPDLRNGNVYLSMLGVDESHAELSLRAIRHARGRIQSLLLNKLDMKTCPTLHFDLDNSLKRGFQVLEILDQVAAERLDDHADDADADDDNVSDDDHDERQSD